MVETRTVLTNKLGLHARAAAMLTKAASQFACAVQLKGNNRTANAKSVLRVMALGLAVGSEIVITAEGSDEVACLDALTALIENRFYEDQ